MRRRLVVTIDELRLHGFDARQGSAIGDAVSAELTRLLAADPVGAPPLARAQVDAGTFSAPTGAQPRALGAGIAASVGRGLRSP